MLDAACQEAQSFSSPPLLLAVTALTSLTDEEIQSIGVTEPMPKWVERLAELAFQSGIRGLVASASELAMLRRKFGCKLQFVIPGIRPAGTAVQDQSRIATPAEAIRAGADYLVVGRPILQAPDPVSAADSIAAEIGQASLEKAPGKW